MPIATTREAEKLLDEIAKALDVPQSRYEQANERYQSFGRWLSRDASSLREIDCRVYLQGSFRLGTAIRPSTDEDHFDLDIVSEFQASKRIWTQAQLKHALGVELKAYATAHEMQVPEEWERCWTLNYAESAQFHIDVLPCVPEAGDERRTITEAGVEWAIAQNSVGITDQAHPEFRYITSRWFTSNPNGYADWFYMRMQPVFVAKRKAMMLAEAKVDVEEIPVYRVKTPLQSAVQLLKRHRDVSCAEEPENAPTSIVITTLAAHAYGQEETISGALYSILERMDRYIDQRAGVSWIANPSNRRENFADAWANTPAKERAFEDWLSLAREDFSAAARLTQDADLLDTLSPRLGRRIVEMAASTRSTGAATSSILQRPTLASGLARVKNAFHRKEPVWPVYKSGNVRIKSATVRRSGFRPYAIANGEHAVPKYAEITFRAETNVERPYKVYWQVVNTGPRILGAQLRGGFDEHSGPTNNLTRTEQTSYTGTHSIECFIVKDGHVRAQSGQFVINID